MILEFRTFIDSSSFGRFDSLNIQPKEAVYMSEKHPECPLYNPLNCKEYYNPKLCAFTRKDKQCLKKKKPKARSAKK